MHSNQGIRILTPAWLLPCYVTKGKSLSLSDNFISSFVKEDGKTNVCPQSLIALTSHACSFHEYSI